MTHERMEDHASCMSDIDPVRDILEEKESLDPTYDWCICIEYLREVTSNIEELILEGFPRSSLDRPILDNTDHAPLFLEEGVSDSRSSWIDSEDEHSRIFYTVMKK